VAKEILPHDARSFDHVRVALRKAFVLSVIGMTHSRILNFEI
jgi:hypothetical protein